MALAISSIPVLTGDVARNFETQAKETYERHLNSSAVEKKEINARYERGMKMVQKILAKSKLRDR